jgi:hypothetical protein
MATERGQYRFSVKEGAEGQPFMNRGVRLSMPLINWGRNSLSISGLVFLLRKHGI